MPNNSQQIARVLQTLLRSTRGKLGGRWIVVLMVLVGGYLFAEPVLEARLGIDLPGVHSPDAPALVSTQTPPKGPPTTGGSRSTEAKRTSPVTEPSTTSTTPSADPAKLTEVLEQVGRDAYRTDAGLVYTRGSVHGHRLKHLMSHAADEPDRPGQHGVFDETDPVKLIELVDEAYLQALSGKQTQKSYEEGREVYTVDMGRRIGYIGGESGARRNHPSARHIRMVIDGERLITAFPIRP